MKSVPSKAKSLSSQPSEKDYFSSNNFDSSDLEFYDVTDDEGDDDVERLANVNIN